MQIMGNAEEKGGIEDWKDEITKLINIGKCLKQRNQFSFKVFHFNEEENGIR